MKPVCVTLNVDGMTCASCEARIQAALGVQKGVTSVVADASAGFVRFCYDPGQTKLKMLISIIDDLGYLAELPGVAKQKAAPLVLLGAGVLLLAGILIAGNTLGMNFVPRIDSGMSYGLLFVVGLITSLHCVAMCGGINLSQCVSHAGQREEARSKLAPSALYNLGRVVSYTLIGGIVGAVGAVIPLSGAAKGVISAVAGVFMVLMGLNMLGLLPFVRRLMPKLKVGQGARDKATQMGPFFVGLLNGLMPCGPLQSMQLYALGTGSFGAGALSMLAFSLGTVPLMFGLGALCSLLSGQATRRLIKVGAALVVVLGVAMLGRGMSLSGFDAMNMGGQSVATVAQPEAVKPEVQYVTSKVLPRSYPEITVEAGVPVVWTIQAEEKDLNGCNEAIVIPKFGIELALHPGNNLVEFTPDGPGSIAFSCWMGMIRSKINVT